MRLKIARLFLVAVLLTACATQSIDSTDFIHIYHDDERSVTCWVFWAGQAGGISCIPDSQLEQ